MAASIWVKTDKWMRALHLYTGLFLAPWMIIYALSAFYLNHFQSVSSAFNIKPATFKFISQSDFTPPDDFPENREARAELILQHVNLDGPFRIQGQPNNNQFTINRLSGSGNYRVTYLPRNHKIKVEQQGPFSTWRFLNFLHFRHGYNFSSAPYAIWAVVVDTTAFSMILWVLSGIYIWARLRNKRFWGSVSLIAGVVLFIALVAIMLN